MNSKFDATSLQEHKWPFLLKLLVTVKIMYKKKVYKCGIHIVKAVQVNTSNAYMKMQSMN